MLQLRHTGLYVENLEKMTAFYKNVFSMYEICVDVRQNDALIHDLFQDETASVRITKLITEQGKINGFGDMLELLQMEEKKNPSAHGLIYSAGSMHLGFGVDDINDVTDRLVKAGGQMITGIHTMPNGKKCCFCHDPEGNGIELIQ